MKLTGSYQINLEKQKVWEALNDPEILKKTIPGCEKFKRNSDTEFLLNFSHPGIVFFNISGSFNASQTFCFSKLIW
jgi:carbon monoxide dehydrogenase subunit G